MPRQNTIIVVILVLGFASLNGVGLVELIAVERERVEVQREGIEVQRCVHFEQRVSEIKSDIRHRQALLKEKWQRDRDQILSEGINKLMPTMGPKDAGAKVAEWIKNLDGNCESADVDLLAEEHRIREAHNQIWGKGIKLEFFYTMVKADRMIAEQKQSHSAAPPTPCVPTPTVVGDEPAKAVGPRVGGIMRDTASQPVAPPDR